MRVSGFYRICAWKHTRVFEIHSLPLTLGQLVFSPGDTAAVLCLASLYQDTKRPIGHQTPFRAPLP